MNKADNFLRAFGRLQEAVKVYETQPENDLLRDALIQRFEFTTELSWKSLREYLEDQGISPQPMPKPVLREAYAAGLVQDEKVWISILDARNQSSHLYSESLAKKVAARICQEYIPAFQSLAELYRS